MESETGYKLISKEPSIAWVDQGILTSERMDSSFFESKYLITEKKLNDFGVIKFEKIIDELSGGATPRGANYLDAGIKFLRAQNIKENQFDLSDVSCISEEDDEKLNRSRLQEQDIVMTITGYPGVAAVVTEDFLPANISQHSVRIKINDFDPYFVSTFINSYYGERQINRRSYGGTRQAINYRDIKRLKIPNTSPEIQKYIGDKIRKAEKLREEAKNLRNEAETILQSELKINNDVNNTDDKIYKWVNKEKLKIKLVPQYYDEIYEKIEEKLLSYKCKSLIDLCKDFSITVPYSKDYGDKSSENIIPMLRVKNISEYMIDTNSMVYMNEKYYNNNEKCRIFNGDILFSRVGTIGKVAIYKYKENAAMAQNITRIRLKSDINKYYFLCYINSKISKLMMERETNLAVQSNLTNTKLKELKIPILDKEKQKEIGAKVKKHINNLLKVEELIEEAKQDVEDLIDGNLEVDN